jgi:hypothetical protein
MAPRASATHRGRAINTKAKRSQTRDARPRPRAPSPSPPLFPTPTATHARRAPLGPARLATRSAGPRLPKDRTRDRPPASRRSRYPAPRTPPRCRKPAAPNRCGAAPVWARWGDDLVLNVRGPSRVFVVIAGRALLVRCRSTDAADRSCGSRAGRGSVGGWRVGVSGVRVAGGAAGVGSVPAGAGRGRVSA